MKVILGWGFSACILILAIIFMWLGICLVVKWLDELGIWVVKHFNFIRKHTRF